MRLITLIATALYSYQNSKKIEVEVEVSLGVKANALRIRAGRHSRFDEDVFLFIEWATGWPLLNRTKN